MGEDLPILQTFILHLQQATLSILILDSTEAPTLNMFYKTYAILQLLSVGTVILASNVQGCTTFDSSMEEFSATFKEPQPPRLLTEFGASFIQHKWRVSVRKSADHCY